MSCRCKSYSRNISERVFSGIAGVGLSISGNRHGFCKIWLHVDRDISWRLAHSRGTMYLYRHLYSEFQTFNAVKESIEKMEPTIITAGYIMIFWEIGWESLYRLEILFNPLVNWFTWYWLAIIPVNNLRLQ